MADLAKHSRGAIRGAGAAGRALWPTRRMGQTGVCIKWERARASGDVRQAVHGSGTPKPPV
ncbi:hypothetical protein GGTG_04109 [Gaeumannomyces tritici R3-111a-1]|uniref:Uncharacterized protein n=1 Tax=Gaeumannomyces tritici (strain R3-111a-1) TaxID=644352 RepID=J3NS63_GAET3|nr:hypothetical protein GGTG_04109 [Gaeumannomyces tritici R3-111a-1]EJT79019.1 hypothetical protein GGTG_04109 [Gaeumannomyces tritici R3-111a-1]